MLSGNKIFYGCMLSNFKNGTQVDLHEWRSFKSKDSERTIRSANHFEFDSELRKRFCPAGRAITFDFGEPHPVDRDLDRAPERESA
ncbi:hypothetical protein CEXT_321971 [Caerostris extrusa]|uniref:Uncharacterized protein n=1 Tax=Caerostris extrusa TaxID=172846 RepID=A0AAV4QF34_CAEEX|nr:hypothetical protein CEXT_321971 [Caerostris extrusa]